MRIVDNDKKIKQNYIHIVYVYINYLKFKNNEKKCYNM